MDRARRQMEYYAPRFYNERQTRPPRYKRRRWARDRQNEQKSRGYALRLLYKKDDRDRRRRRRQNI